jgi:hypothetical protein
MQALARERVIRLCGGDGCVGKAMPVGIQRGGASVPKGHLVNKMLEQHTRGKRLRPIQKQVANIFGPGPGMRSVGRGRARRGYAV